MFAASCSGHAPVDDQIFISFEEVRTLSTDLSAQTGSFIQNTKHLLRFAARWNLNLNTDSASLAVLALQDFQLAWPEIVMSGVGPAQASWNTRSQLILENKRKKRKIWKLEMWAEWKEPRLLFIFISTTHWRLSCEHANKESVWKCDEHLGLFLYQEKEEISRCYYCIDSFYMSVTL